MYQFEKIKLIIWDLDETLWKGTLSEEDVLIPEDVSKLIKDLTDIGIVNSICSKNDFSMAKTRLEDEGLWEYFVFPSINWEAKGARTKQLIQDMALRNENVLFLDDNPSNREEVRYFCPNIMVEGPWVLRGLSEQAHCTFKKDPEHKRLSQYRLLEEKQEAKSCYSSNEAFLMESDIRLEIAHDCIENIERLYELNLRSNQLNFTKNRCSKDELMTLCADPTVKSGYVHVKDRFGDYGVVGFYAAKENRLIHFVFSCRTLGMGIEQYVYNWLHRPELITVGEVISDLSVTELPKWINIDRDRVQGTGMIINNLDSHMVLVKGPCDLFQIYPYISQTELFDTEFTYTNNRGITIESTGHTTHVVEAGRLSAAQKNLVIREVPFADKGQYNDNIYKYPYKVVFLSILTDANLGVYQRKGTGERLVFLEGFHPLTNPENWDSYITGAYRNAGVCFTKEMLQAFSEKYEFLGCNSPAQIVENLNYIRRKLSPGCLLAIMLGGELYYEKNTMPAYENRHIVHREINSAIRSWAEGKNNVRLIDVNKYIVDQSSFYDHFNHYIKPVYYALAREMVDIVNGWTGSDIRETSRLKMIAVRAKEVMAPVYYKLRGIIKWGGKTRKKE